MCIRDRLLGLLSLLMLQLLPLISGVASHGALGYVPPWSLQMHANFADLTPDGFHFWMTLSPRTSESVRHAPVPPGAKFWRRHWGHQRERTAEGSEFQILGYATEKLNPHYNAEFASGNDVMIIITNLNSGAGGAG